MFAPMSELPILKQASDALKLHEPKLLHSFARVFNRKRPPQSMRALAPLAMVLLLEAFGLAFLLNRDTIRLALAACRGPGKGNEDDMLDDSDDMAAIRWAAHRQGSLDRAYRSLCREVYNSESTGYTYPEWIKKSNSVPNRITFERQWGERNPIDPSTAPKCFDPSAQLSILDALGQGDGYLGAFVSNIMLRSDATKSITLFGQTLDLAGVETLDEAASRAVMSGWIAYLDHRGAIVGLRLIPRTDGIQTRLRAPLANIVAMYADDPRDEQIAQLKKDNENLAESNRSYSLSIVDVSNKLAAAERSIEWHRQEMIAATIELGFAGSTIEEAARASTKERDMLRSGMSPVHKEIEGVATTHADGHTTIVVDDSDIGASASKVKIGTVPNCGISEEYGPNPFNDPPVSESPGIWRMVWPDKDAAPAPLACANTIVAHRRGEFAELEFPASAKIFDQVRAWLGYYQFGICTPSFDSSKYGHCAIGANGEIPPSWGTMKESKRNAYPGFVLFAPDGSARVVFRAKEATFGKVGKRKVKEAKS